MQDFCGGDFVYVKFVLNAKYNVKSNKTFVIFCRYWKRPFLNEFTTRKYANKGFTITSTLKPSFNDFHSQIFKCV